MPDNLKRSEKRTVAGHMIAQMSRIAKIIRRGMRELLRKPGDRARRAVDKLAMAAGGLGPVLPGQSPG
jgi:hypothetical protein